MSSIWVTWKTGGLRGLCRQNQGKTPYDTGCSQLLQTVFQQWRNSDDDFTMTVQQAIFLKSQ